MPPVPLWKTLVIVLVSFFSLLQLLPTLLGGVPVGWPSWLPSEMIHRGLDLQGGLHLLLHVEVEKAVEQSTENLVDEVRDVLRDKKLRNRGIEREGIDAVSVKISEPSEVQAVQEALQKAFPNLSAAAATDAVRLSLPPEEKERIRQFAVDQGIQTIRSRVDQFGVSEPAIQKQGTDRILVQLPGLSDVGRAKALIGRTARLEFKLVDEMGDLSAALKKGAPPGDVILYGEKKDPVNGQAIREPYLLKKRTVLAGDTLTDARVNFTSSFNEPYVGITFNRQGARKFAQLTGEHVKERMAIVLDDKVYSAPVIQEKIEGGRAQITGSFSPEEAHDLAIVLRAGALPAPVTVLEERSVGPTMGKDSIEDGLRATAIGGLLVMAFMVLYYRRFGWLSNLAVFLNLVILLGVLAAMRATLTLPGIAGVVLLVGMAVDANVLINERIREELRLGKTPIAAIQQGYDRAFSTILDSNLTTLIIAIVLFQFGTGPVRGFAVTLSIGLVASMFTAIFVTRVILGYIYANKRPKSLSI